MDSVLSSLSSAAVIQLLLLLSRILLPTAENAPAVVRWSRSDGHGTGSGSGLESDSDSSQILSRIKRQYCSNCGCCQQQQPQYQPAIIQYQNPCMLGGPLLLATGYPQMCQWDVQTCPGTYFCHIGFSIQTTCCCPQISGDPCQQPLQPGVGAALLQRWYFDPNTRTCNAFTYRGTKGNQNNFLSKDLCQSACQAFDNPCEQSTTQQYGLAAAPLFCTGGPVGCPQGQWCHVGMSPETTVCCPGFGQQCTAQLNAGLGNGNLPRWWFNPTKRLCEPFIYHGLKGNQNNHESRAACESACNQYETVCPVNDPSLLNVRPPKCSLLQPCPAALWCHIGATADMTECCSKTGDTCTLPVSQGRGEGTIQRWYFDATSKTCLNFIYKGARGNENNFLTKEACESTCKVFENPCNSPTPILDATGKPLQCNGAIGVAQCQAGAFCHIGATMETTVCCPGVVPGCGFPKLEGQGSASLPRWYYNSLARRCDTFLYRGLKGNANNFLSLEECESTCKQPSPCAGGLPPLDRGGQMVQCSSTVSSCPPTHFCHIGIDTASTVCCQKAGNPCDILPLIGTGTSRLSRWAYNAEQDICLPFVYTGIGGNENNFLTKLECERTCPGFRGYCPHGSPLIVGAQPQSCGIETACPSNFVCHVNSERSASVCCVDPEYFCFLPVATGNCRDNIQRYAYDQRSDSCKPFQWTGCGGNLNNFENFEECTKLCCKQPPLPGQSLPFVQTRTRFHKNQFRPAQSGFSPNVNNRSHF